MSTIDMISTAGVTLILAAFVLNTFDMLKEKSKAFFLLNIFGAGLAGWGAYLASFWPFVVLEIVWVLVGIWGLYKHISNPSDHTG
jgi:hypothetical protein